MKRARWMLRTITALILSGLRRMAEIWTRVMSVLLSPMRRNLLHEISGLGRKWNKFELRRAPIAALGFIVKVGICVAPLSGSNYLFQGATRDQELRTSVSNAKQILAMLRSRADGDEERFFTIALQVAATEARQGHRSVAEGLREAVEKARANTGRGQAVAVPFSAPRGDLADLIELRSPSHRLDDVVLNVSLRGQLDDLIREQARRDWLREHGKTPNRRILFVGPPGSGKTMTAEALAVALKLPLFVIRLEALITRFMGETAAKLRLAFDETAKRRGVYLFDEFDAIGGRRSAPNDVAEMRRVLNSFLQFMEEPNATDSLIAGATNHPDLLDRALLRRFDLVLLFEMPTDEQIRRVIKAYLRPMKYPNLSWKRIVEAGHGLSQSELARAAEKAVKAAILDERNRLTTKDVVGVLNERREMREAFISMQAPG